MRAVQACSVSAVRAVSSSAAGLTVVVSSSLASSLASSRAARRPPSTMASCAHCTTRRAFSQQVSEWVGRLQYGSEHAPFFGSRGNAFSIDALATRQLYCKALVYASGGSRSARDWVAGSTALSSPNQALLHIALQYTATEADVWQLRATLLEALIDSEEGKADAAATADTTSSTASAASTEVGGAGSAESHAPTEEDVFAAESFLLSHAPEVRCFLFDAMTAGLFNAHAHSDSVEQCRRHIFDIGQRVFGVPREVLTSLWRVAQADLVIRKDKQRAFGQARVD